MSKLIKEVVEFFAKQPSALEAFIVSKEPKTHADVEHWTRWYEAHGICRGF